MKKAAIDIGSNSVILIVAELQGKDILQQKSFSEITSLGNKIKLGYFQNQSMQDTLDCLLKFAEIIKQNNISPDMVRVTATEASRLAKNAKEFFHKVFKLTGLKVNIIDATREAELTALGVSSSVEETRVLLLDMGGASTEFIIIDKLQGMLMTSSLPLGSVKYMNHLDSSDEGAALKLLSTFDTSQYTSFPVYISGGTATSLAALMLNLSDYEIRLIIQNTKAQILGLALKDTPTNTQRRILSLAERTYAESAFEIMTTPLSNEHIDSKRAKDKIKSIIVQIIKRRQANLIS